MEWLALSIAFVATIYFAIHYRGFRRGLLFLAAGAAVLAAMAAIYFWNDSRQTEARRQIASKLISREQIIISNAQLALGTVPQITGTVTNKSPYELKEMEIKVVVSDCPSIFDDIGPEAKCGIVGESKEWIYSINSPRGQKRAFKSYVSLPNLPEMKEWSWRYSIEQVIAKY